MRSFSVASMSRLAVLPCAVVAAFAVVVMSGVSASAQGDSPASVVQEIVSRLKETRSPVVVLDYVHWYTAFAAFPEKDKQAINVKTPEELHKYYERVFTDPATLIREQIGPKVKTLPEDQRPLLEAQLAKMEGVIQQRFAEMKDKIGKTEYTVGKVSQQGDDAASVELTTMLEGKSSTNEVKLVKVDGKWMLPATQFVKPPQTAPTSTSPDPGVTRIDPQVPTPRAPETPKNPEAPKQP